MMRVAHIVARQRMFEGFQSAPYKDSLGIWTIGYGATTWGGERVTPETPPVSIMEAQQQLKAHVLDAIADVQALYGDVLEDLSDVEQEVLVHMAFQLGRKKLAGFKRMNEAIRAYAKTGYYQITAWLAEMKDSRWYRQTPRPAKALMAALDADEWQGSWRISA